MDLEVALHKCGGAARWRTLRGLGVPAHQLRGARELAVARGAFALPHAAAALVAAVRLGGVASHGSAAALYGFGSWRPEPTVHITVASGSRLPEPGVRIHRARLQPVDVDPFRALTSPLRTVVDCCRVMPLPEALVVVDAALHSGAVRRAALQAAADEARGKGAASLRRAVRFADELAESPLESVLRLILSILNCDLRTQVHIPGVGTVDFVLDGWLVVEGDGFEFHSDRRAYRGDRGRLNELAAQGYTLLRFTWEDIRFRPGWVLEQVARVLGRHHPHHRPHPHHHRPSHHHH
jgi:very-short-patch-repair endonuclease